MAPSYLITSASGHIGQRLVPLLLSRPSKPTLVLPTSNAARLTSALPSDAETSRIHVREGNIKNPVFIDAALEEHNVTAVFLCLTGEDELFTTFNILDSIRRSSSVKHLVYLSAAGDFSLEAQQNGCLTDIWCAHVAVKCMIEAKIRHGIPTRDQEGGFSWSILGPTLFFGNDLRSAQGMLEENVLDEPYGSKGVSRVSEDDIALAAVKLLEDDGKQWGGKKVMIGSLKTYTAQDIARLWSQALGKEIKHLVSDRAVLDDFENRFRKMAGPAWARDLKLMYEIFEKMPFEITVSQYQEQVALLGKEPESYEKFVEATGKTWRE